MRTLGNNLEVLYRRYPQLKNRIKILPSQTNSPYIFDSGRRGSFYLTYENTRMCSSYDPVKEVNRLFTGFSAEESSSHILTSAGLGYEICEFRKLFPTKTLHVIEFNGTYFSALLSHMDFTDLLSDKMIHWHLPFLFENNRELSKMTSAIGLKTVLVPMNSSWNKLETPESAQFFKNLQNISNHQLSNKLTLQRQERLWNRNYSENLIHSEHYQSLTAYGDLLKGKECLILAAGPSLEKVLPFLKKNRAFLFIICVDTALRFCFQNEIIPDFVVAGDAQFYNSRHFTGISEELLKKTDLVCNLTVHPSIMRQNWCRILLYRSTVPLSRQFYDLEQRVPYLPSGGSVTTTALSLALFLGTSHIIVAGLDLANSQQLSHYRGSYPETTERSVNNREESREKRALCISSGDSMIVKGRNNENVITDKRLYFYRNWIEQFIDKSEIPVTDICGEGIYIEGLLPPESLRINRHSNSKSEKPVSSEKMQTELIQKPLKNMIESLSAPVKNQIKIQSWLPGLEYRSSDEKTKYLTFMKKKLNRLKKEVKSY